MGFRVRLQTQFGNLVTRVASKHGSGGLDMAVQKGIKTKQLN